MNKLHDDQKIGYIDRIRYKDSDKIYICSKVTGLWVDYIKELIDIGAEVYTYYKMNCICFKIISIEIGKDESGNDILSFNAESTAYMKTYKNKIERYEYWALLQSPIYVEEKSNVNK